MEKSVANITASPSQVWTWTLSVCSRADATQQSQIITDISEIAASIDIQPYSASLRLLAMADAAKYALAHAEKFSAEKW